MSSPDTLAGPLRSSAIAAERWLVGGVFLAFAIMAGTLSLIAFASSSSRTRSRRSRPRTGRSSTTTTRSERRSPQQTKKLARRRARGCGSFLIGRATRRVRTFKLPRAGRPLASPAADGVVDPASASIRSRLCAADLGRVDGYAVRWPGLALFASGTDPLSCGRDRLSAPHANRERWADTASAA